jgi:hypothetical protein
LQLGLNIARGHAARIERNDFVIKALQPCLPLLDELRFEAALAVTRHLDLDLSLLAFEGFLTVPIAFVPVGVALARMFGVAQVRVQFRFQAALDHGLGQLFRACHLLPGCPGNQGSL